MKKRVAVIIPCYRVKELVQSVLENIGSEVDAIFVIDDACPEKTGEYVLQNNSDKRVQVLFNSANEGVGGAVITGYRAAMEAGYDILVKIDGDGQMNPKLIGLFISPLINGEADYTKGNRFWNLSGVAKMPKFRLVINSLLSMLNKLSSGYWHIFDPTNGYTAIHASVAARMDLDKVGKGYIFETDMLFRLGIIKAVVLDIPMDAVYGSEKSSVRNLRVLCEFTHGHIKNTFKRIFYNYFLRDMSIASFELVIGSALLIFGTVFGLIHWNRSIVENRAVTSGTVMLAALPIILGIQLILSFIAYDIRNTPLNPLHKLLGDNKTLSE